MSKRNSLDQKLERRKLKFLKNLTMYWNRTQYREIDGQMYPHQRPYRNFLQDYLDGKLKVIQKGGEFIMEENQTTTEQSPVENTENEEVQTSENTENTENAQEEKSE